MNKILFLDIDGVINNEKSLLSEDETEYVSVCKFDKNSLETLSKICKNTSAKVVLTSTWRRFFIFKEDGTISFRGGREDVCKNVRHVCKGKSLYDTFCEYGIEIIDKIPSIKDPRSDWARGAQIMEYIKANNVSSYVIIDDDDVIGRSETCGELLKDHFVQTDFYNGGLKDEHYEKILKILKESEGK